VAGESCGLTSVSDVRSGKPHDLEKQRLAEIIDRLNDLYGAEVSNDDKLHFANGISDRIERDESVMAQIRHHDEAQVIPAYS
jgi:type I restriction enzyme R subunit